MSYFIGIMGVVALLFSIGSCAMSKGAIHEIEGLIWLLIAVVLFSVEALLDALKSTKKGNAGASKDQQGTS